LKLSGMRGYVCSVVALVVLAIGAPAQDPNPSTLSPPAAQPNPPIELKPDASGTVPPEQIRALLLRAEQNDLENTKRLRDYTYVERVERRKLDGQGRVKKTESTTLDVLDIYGEQLFKRIAKDDKPLNGAEARKEDEKIQKIIDKHKNESEGERRKRLEKEEKGREEDRKFVLEIADAFNFRLMGSEVVDGFDSWALDAVPRAGYEPRQRGSKMLTKFKGRVWINKSDAQMAKLDMTAIDTLSFGWLLARIHPGTHVILEQTKINDEVWLPKHLAVHVDARVALFKSLDEDVDVTYRDYKKFRTETKVTVVGETP
jgi:hypothetical protein